MATAERGLWGRIEEREIHLALCRARRQGLMCSLCIELIERAARFDLRTVA